MIDTQALLDALDNGFRPLPGKCLIEMDELPTMSGPIHIPDTARELRMASHSRGKTLHGDSSFTGRVLAVTPRRSRTTGDFLSEDFKPGDRVLIMLLQEDLDKKVFVSVNTRVYAVITN